MGEQMVDRKPATPIVWLPCQIWSI